MPLKYGEVTRSWWIHSIMISLLIRFESCEIFVSWQFGFTQSCHMYATMLLCIYFIIVSCLFALARSFKMILNENGDRTQYVLFIQYNSICWFLVAVIYLIEKISLYSWFAKNFLLKIQMSLGCCQPRFGHYWFDCVTFL